MVRAFSRCNCRIVTRDTISRCTRELTVHVTFAAVHIRMRAAQREFCYIVVETRDVSVLCQAWLCQHQHDTKRKQQSAQRLQGDTPTIAQNDGGMRPETNSICMRLNRYVRAHTTTPF